jgi:hypothetical protein
MSISEPGKLNESGMGFEGLDAMGLENVTVDVKLIAAARTDLTGKPIITHAAIAASAQ